MNIKKIIKSHYIGISLAVIITIVSYLLKPYFGYLGTTTIALLIGIVIQLPQTKKGAKWIEKSILPFAIMLMGMTISTSALQSLGVQTIGLVILMIVVTICSAVLLGKLFGIDSKLALLIGTGNAVCGSSAILSSSKVIDADDVTTGTSVAIINFLGVIGIFLIPFIASVLGFNLVESSILMGGTLQSVGNVTASSAFIEGSTSLAIITKMMRVSCLVAILIIYSFMYKTPGQKLALPKFIIGFVVLFFVGNSGFVPEVLMSTIDALTDILLVVSMAAIGLSINIKEILSVGKDGLFLAMTNWVIQIIVYIIFIVLLNY